MCIRDSEERGRSAVKILADVLEVVAELEQHSPIEGNLAFLFGEPAADEAGIGEDGCAALSATDAEDLVAAQGLCGGELGNALLLRQMDGKQRCEDLRVMCSMILAFDHPNQSPDGCFVCIANGKMLAAQAPAESRTEEALGGRGRVATVEIVVGIGVKEAIANDRRRDVRGLVEEGLEAVGGPGVTASLNDFRHGEGLSLIHI